MLFRSYLILTINQSELLSISKQENIIALGNIDRNYINFLLSCSSYLIFPSIIESLGIPLLEAKFSNLKIIASNIKIVNEISSPFLSFNPEEINSIKSAILSSIKI